ncbi:hypothetical protein N9B34_03130 [Akkermansiaceae bacterium]|nr:hypothetical protein [Akkermansiaceae bacterium]
MRCFLLFSLLIVVSSAAQIIRAPYVQMATHDSIRVVWRTNGDIAPTVKVGLKPDELTTEVPAAQILTRLHETVGQDWSPARLTFMESSMARRESRQLMRPINSPRTQHQEVTLPFTFG